MFNVQDLLTEIPKPNYESEAATHFFKMIMETTNDLKSVGFSQAEIHMLELLLLTAYGKISELDSVKISTYLSFKSREYFTAMHKLYTMTSTITPLSSKGYEQAVENIAYKITLSSFHTECCERANNPNIKGAFEDPILENDMNSLSQILSEVALASGVFYTDILNDIQISVHNRINKIVEWYLESNK